MLGVQSKAKVSLLQLSESVVFGKLLFGEVVFSAKPFCD